MEYIAFTDYSAGFAWSRLNNVLFAAESLIRVEIVNARALKLSDAMNDNEKIVVDQVMAMYDCHYTDELPPGLEAYDPQPPTLRTTRKAKDYPVGTPTQYFREERPCRLDM